MISNEGKARQLADKSNTIDLLNQMAEWKDQQFRKYLEAKMRDRTIPVSRPWIRVLSDIIKELYHREEENI